MYKIKDSRKINVLNLIEDSVILARANIAKKYDVTKDGKYANYAGLCDVTVLEFKSLILKNHKDFIEYISVIHGEQAHSPRIISSKWYLEHTWCQIILRDGSRYYIDPTSSQFQDLYSEIPDYYISKRRPKWFLPDSRNIRYNAFFRPLQQMATLKYYEYLKRYLTVAELIQVRWGYISDILHKLYYKE